ncbi:molecular chaperone [Brevundimonas sp.]|jgi:P pilus assembly chaperone PapD|uniref:molecular chaperone n=1 Tax=Brevundimonas sp. TaxID=1871086 RepID=UPI0037C08223
MMLRFLVPVFAFLLMAEPALAQVGADLNISPKRVVFGPGERSATVYIFNQGDQPATYTVELVDRVMLPDGQIVAVADHPEARIESAQDLVQYTPRRITLQPRESQAIRVRARPGEGGEHRSHLTVTALPPESTGFTVDQAAGAGENEVSLQVVALFSVSIPVIVRDGAADARAAIDRLSVSKVEDQTLVSLDLVRQGANSVYGDVEIYTEDRAGRQLLTAVRGVAVYPEVERRTVIAPLPSPITPGQTLTVIYRNDDDADSGAVLATATLIAP